MMKSGPRLPQLEKALAQKRRPNTAKNKLKKKKMPPKYSAGALSNFPKHKKAVKHLIKKIHVLDKFHSGTLFRKKLNSSLDSGPSLVIIHPL